MQQYRRKNQTSVVAIPLDLDTDGFVYQKWGGTQRCKRGDWVVNNRGDIYTVDRDTFARTYRLENPDIPGIYVKDAPVWAEQAEQPGIIQTKEGSTAYNARDYLVFNDPGRKDGYAMSEERFQSLYEIADS